MSNYCPYGGDAYGLRYDTEYYQIKVQRTADGIYWFPVVPKF